MNWYERRHELRIGDVFCLQDGSRIRLYDRVPGDGTKWYVEDFSHGSWGYWASTIEPSDLDGSTKEPSDGR